MLRFQDVSFGHCALTSRRRPVLLTGLSIRQTDSSCCHLLWSTPSKFVRQLPLSLRFRSSGQSAQKSILACALSSLPEHRVKLSNSGHWHVDNICRSTGKSTKYTARSVSICQGHVFLRKTTMAAGSSLAKVGFSVPCDSSAPALGS